MLQEWEQLLHQARASEVHELGIWGELWFLSLLKDADAGLAAWRGPLGGSSDFFSGGTGIECKASRARLTHHISKSQVDGSPSSAPSFFLSLWAVEDAVQGRSVSDLVSALDERVADLPLWEKLLSKCGFQRDRPDRFATKYLAREEPMLFRAVDVPGVHAVDAGVRQLRYVVDLPESSALSEEDFRAMLSAFQQRAAPVAPPRP